MMGPCPPSKSHIFLHFPTLSLAFLLILTSFHRLTTQSQLSIYEQLRINGLPIGLFPKGITDFSLDSTTGRFNINLTQPCNAKFENQLHYDFNVTGLLSFGKIGNLSGVSQQELFLWLPVKGIRVDVPSSGLIYFDVGVVDKQFSLSLFETPLECTAVDPGHGFADDSSGSDGSENQSKKLASEIGEVYELRAVS